MRGGSIDIKDAGLVLGVLIIAGGVGMFSVAGGVVFLGVAVCVGSYLWAAVSYPPEDH